MRVPKKKRSAKTRRRATRKAEAQRERDLLGPGLDERVTTEISGRDKNLVQLLESGKLRFTPEMRHNMKRKPECPIHRPI